ncbi:hypothetical protein BAE44_0009034 [Dichanthelium oligosanthes]|uniref:Uncharacterized protein n=1 Tax=Dichanthelium oligosanthes TaxID=888268 RepID=A0A1E5VXV9_9POAL|nr:hypothetical protein BAE44_0009034 [Dichanthelium oligosanthes]
MAMVLSSPASRSAAAAASCCFSASSSGPFVVTRGPCFLADFGVGGRGGKRFCYQSSPSSLAYPPRAGSTPEYRPSSPSPRSASPDCSPATPEYSSATPEYMPQSPSHSSPDYFDVFNGAERCYYPLSSPGYSPRAPSPEYTPLSYADPEYTLLTPSSQRAASPDYTPGSPLRRAATPVYTPGTPEYTPLSPPRRDRRAVTPEYTPSTPPPSPAVSDAESHTSPARRRHHPYQRSQTSCGRRHRIMLHEMTIIDRCRRRHRPPLVFVFPSSPRSPRAMAMVLPSRSPAAASFCFSASSSGPFVVKRGACFLADFGVRGRGGKRFCYQSSPSSLAYSRRAGSTPEYTPSNPSRRAGSPEYMPSQRYASPAYAPATPEYSPATPEYTPQSPSGRSSPDYFVADFDVFNGREMSYYPSSSPRYSPRAASPEYTPPTPEYTPLSPSRRSASPDYTPESPPRRGQHATTPEYTPATPEYTPLSLSRCSASPDYTPESPPRRGRRAATPEYTPSTPPPSPAVSDAESRTSPARRRHRPYQRSQTSCGRRHRAFSLQGY